MVSLAFVFQLSLCMCAQVGLEVCGVVMCDRQQKVDLIYFFFEMKLPRQPAGFS